MPFTMAEMPAIVQEYARYQRNIRGRSQKTVNEYCMDLRTFFRYYKMNSCSSFSVPMDHPYRVLPLFLSGRS